MNYLIKNVSSKETLKRTMDFYKRIFEGVSDVDNPEYSLEKWTERMKNHSDLMLYACSENEVIGIVFGRLTGENSMTIGPVAVHEDHQGGGIAKEMVLLLEKRAMQNGVQTIDLGAVDTAEGFYNKLGYSGSLLIQSQVHSIEQLLSLNDRYKVEFTNIYDGTVSQVCLNLTESDKKLMKEYETTFPCCYTMMLFRKNIGRT